MRRALVILSAFLLMASSLRAEDATKNGKWIQLFNGKNLDGWTPKIRYHDLGDNFGDTFRVEDGLLTVSYDGYEAFDNRFGHLFYKKPFSYYRLLVEYRFIGDPAPGTEEWAYRNSGAMVHSQDPFTMPPAQDFPISIEVQFLGGLSDGKDRPTGNMCSPGTNIEYQGKFNSEHCISSSSPTFDGDQWVVAEALVLGSEKIVHFINGEKVIEYAHPTTGGGVVANYRSEMKPEGQALGEGYISLQSEGHAIQFRRVELLNLKGCMDAQARNYKSYFVANDPSACEY